MYWLTVKDHFDSAHFLYGYEGKCSNLHGHEWQIEAQIGSKTLCTIGNQRDMVLDFKDVKILLHDICSQFDHKFIYEVDSLEETTLNCLKKDGFQLYEIPSRPTAEYLSFYIFNELKSSLKKKYLGDYHLKSVTVYETPNNCCTYTEE